MYKRQKLYDLKMKNGWIGSNGSKIMTADSAVDATVSAQSEKMGKMCIRDSFMGRSCRAEINKF